MTLSAGSKLTVTLSNSTGKTVKVYLPVTVLYADIAGVKVQLYSLVPAVSFVSFHLIAPAVSPSEVVISGILSDVYSFPVYVTFGFTVGFATSQLS